LAPKLLANCGGLIGGIAAVLKSNQENADFHRERDI
jgi:hypothetical protein